MSGEESASQKLEAFFRQRKLFHYKRGDSILHAGDEPPGVFYLKRGFVKLSSVSKDGEELTLIIFKPEDFFPMMWAVTEIPNAYYLEAMTTVELCRASREEFIKFIKEHNDVLFDLMGRILVRLGGLLSRMEYLTFGNAHQKVASIIHICSERFGGRVGENVEIQVPLTHRDIADLVGVTRETASIEIKKLERKGLIAFRGRHLVVRDLPNLRQESLVEE